MIKFKDLSGWVKAMIILGLVGLGFAVYNYFIIDLLSEWSFAVTDWMEIVTDLFELVPFE